MAKKNSLKKVLFGALLVTGCLGVSPACAAYKVANFSIDGAFETTPFGINSSGTIVGSYTASETQVKGFVTKLSDLAGPSTKILSFGDETRTIAETINNKGVLVGAYNTADGRQHGFIYDTNTDTFTSYDAPVANPKDTFLHYINDNGDISGHYVDSLDNIQHSFLIKGGVFDATTFQGVPDGNGGFFATDLDTFLTPGHLAGHYYDGALINGFVFLADGTRYFVDTPGFNDTELERMNNYQECVGYLTTTSYKNVAFYLNNPGGDATVISELAAWDESYAEAINDNGSIVGYVSDGTGAFKGFLAIPVGDVNADKVINSFDALLTLQNAVGLYTPPDITAFKIVADVAPLDANGKPKGDNVVDVFDALAILRHAVGLDAW